MPSHKKTTHRLRRKMSVSGTEDTGASLSAHLSQGSDVTVTRTDTTLDQCLQEVVFVVYWLTPLLPRPSGGATLRPHNYDTPQRVSKHNTLTSSGFFSPPFRVPEVNKTAESLIPLSRCVLVFAPLIPLVALVELPPQSDDLSNDTTLPPFSNTV